MRDLDTGVVTLWLSGGLTMRAQPPLRQAIGKAAAECPAAVLVDLSGLGRVAPGSLAVFATATCQAQENWGMPVLLYGAGPETSRALGAHRSFVSLYDDRPQALSAMRAYVPRWMRRRLPPAVASVTAAQELLGEACVAWDQVNVYDNAQLIVSELASNAIRHAGTDFDVITAFTGRYLRIAVRDGSHAMPRLIDASMSGGAVLPAGSGRGLRIVAAAGTHWGATRLRDGKIVWALIASPRRTRTTPVMGPSPLRRAGRR
ncbi:hypothetical protein AB0J83_23830 [Actinoplanes sp. NPDC049596]|uniref:hypothetical protein n=1 Tax=unclassified Actinoplanes TaxID=2626549 RepID=UPI003422B3E4